MAMVCFMTVTRLTGAEVLEGTIQVLMQDHFDTKEVRALDKLRCSGIATAVAYADSVCALNADRHASARASV